MGDIFLERYSDTGFTPRYQSYHLHSDEPILMSDEDYFKWLKESGMNEYQQRMLLGVKRSREDFYREHYEDFINGIWCFIRGHRDDFELNHLNKIPRVNYGVVRSNDVKNVYAYDGNLEKIYPLNDPMLKNIGFYIPEKFVKYIKTCN